MESPLDGTADVAGSIVVVTQAYVISCNVEMAAFVESFMDRRFRAACQEDAEWRPSVEETFLDSNEELSLSIFLAAFVETVYEEDIGERIWVGWLVRQEPVDGVDDQHLHLCLERLVEDERVTPDGSPNQLSKTKVLLPKLVGDGWYNP